MKIRKLFKFLEYTFNKKRLPMEKLRRSESTSIAVNSNNFTDLEQLATKEESRLKDSDVTAKAEKIYY